jgi:nitroreductase
VDAYLAIASKRDVRKYAPRPIPADVEARILDAGRLAGSAVNRQPWTFLVIDDPGVRERLAETVYAPANIRGAALVVAVVGRGKGPVGFDCGRASQSMMLAAWNDGVVSCPNGVAQAEQASAALGLGEDDRLQIVLSFGYPASPLDPESRPASEWSARANRRPPDDVVRRIG